MTSNDSSTSPYDTRVAEEHFDAWLHDIKPSKSKVQEKAAVLAQAVREFFDAKESFSTKTVSAVAFEVHETITVATSRHPRMALEVRFENDEWCLQWLGKSGALGTLTKVDLDYNPKDKVFEWSEDTARENGLVVLVDAVLAALKKSHENASQSALMG